eukprot:gene23720-biopygen10379
MRAFECIFDMVWRGVCFCGDGNGGRMRAIFQDVHCNHSSKPKSSRSAMATPSQCWPVIASRLWPRDYLSCSPSPSPLACSLRRSRMCCPYGHIVPECERAERRRANVADEVAGWRSGLFLSVCAHFPPMQCPSWVRLPPRQEWQRHDCIPHGPLPGFRTQGRGDAKQHVVLWRRRRHSVGAAGTTAAPKAPQLAPKAPQLAPKAPQNVPKFPGLRRPDR